MSRPVRTQMLGGLPGGALLVLMALASSEALQEAPPSDPGAADARAVEETLITPFVERAKSSLGSGSDGGKWLPTLRVLLGDIEALAASLSADVARRRSTVEAAREALISRLAASMGDPDGRGRALKLVTSAAKKHLDMRTSRLHQGLICWCREENWTRTLQGCTDTCAMPQKTMIETWIAEGYMDEEIIQKMVDHPLGGPKVRALPEAKGWNLVAYWLPFALGAVGIVLVAVRLLRFLRPPRKGEAAAEPASREDDESSERIEKELREMES
ncbi:MAG TPA: cytochrome c-type biogenesis protein CcmH [Planctomycetota bacterium]|nr:cytochrome c-type biogenesis protein CcmH [Planctomycetota bacterium]